VRRFIAALTGLPFICPRRESASELAHSTVGISGVKAQVNLRTPQSGSAASKRK